MSEDLVLVTGASGFVGIHCVREALSQGYRVRATVRNANDNRKVQPIRNLCQDEQKLQIVSLELQSDQDVWNKVVAGCTYVLHVASPVITNVRSSERMSRVVQPAIDGILRVMNAARESDTVTRVVLTSSTAPKKFAETDTPFFTESDWCDYSDPNSCGAYKESKTRAEETAFAFVKEHKTTFDVISINPGYIFGPVLSPVSTPSYDIIIHPFTGPPFYLDIQFSSVDVRDVAELHVKGMTDKKLTNASRVIAFSASPYSVQILEWLREEFGPQGYTGLYTKYVVPHWATRIAGYFSPQMRVFSHTLGKDVKFSNDKMKAVLGKEPRPLREAIIEQTYSLIENGFIPKQPQQ